MRTATIRTVQGIGDIFWVYQKVAPHVQRIKFQIMRVGDEPVQFRAREFVSLLPQVVSVDLPLVNRELYHAVAQHKYDLPAALTQPDFTYAVNARLEAGEDLYELDNLEVQDFVDLPWQLPGGFAPKPAYLCLFVAGSVLDYVWSMTHWVDMADALAQQLGLKNIVTIGASWDRWIMTDVVIGLQRRGYTVRDFTAQIAMMETIGVIKCSEFFFGYQSGLNVIADNFNVPQLMVYFPKLRDMMYTWPKKANRAEIFKAVTFDDGHVLDTIRRCHRYELRD